MLWDEILFGGWDVLEIEATERVKIFQAYRMTEDQDDILEIGKNFFGLKRHLTMEVSEW